MKLTNAMEPIVRERLSQLRAQAGPGGGTCWCPLCRADMMALALSRLPPRYATRRPATVEDDSVLAEVVHAEVLRAALHVGRNPKHGAGGAVATGSSVWVVNLPLEESFRAIGAMLRDSDGACDCWHCRCDMVAFALNRHPSRYGVEHGGQTRHFEDERRKMRTELAAFLELAIRVVTTVPRHDFSAATA
jgi:hypothetical protein